MAKQECTCGLSSHKLSQQRLGYRLLGCDAVYFDKTWGLITKLDGVISQTTIFSFSVYFTTPSATCTNYITNKLSPMEQWPGETNGSSAMQEIPCNLMNPKVRYRVHNSPSFTPTVSHIIPIYALLPCFFNIRFNIILPPMPRCFKWPVFFRFLRQNPPRFSHPPPTYQHKLLL